MNGNNARPIRIELRPDGVYVVLNNSDSERTIFRHEVMRLIELYGVKDVNFDAIDEIFESEEPLIEKKISSVLFIIQEPETIKIEATKDGLRADIRFIPPVNDGALLTLDELKKQIAAQNIKYGFDDSMLEQLIIYHDYNKSYTLATGSEAIPGRDGFLNYHVDIGKKKLTPKILEDGRADFRDLGLLELVTAGQKLVTAVQEVPGTDGMTVFGVPIPTKAVKPPPPLPRGKNTAVSEDGNTLVSELDGQVIYDSKKITVSPVLVIEKSVDNSTGDVVFNGSVVIKGAVLTGFSVSAPGNIEVYGIVEGAKLTSKGSIFLYRGVQGQGKAVIRAGVDINIKFAQDSTLVAGRNIVGDNILHSNVKCGGYLELSGKKGLLVGGKIVVGEKIMAKTIGSPMATVTEIEAGHDPEILKEYRALVDELLAAKAEHSKVEKTVELLNTQNKQGLLTDDKKSLLLKAIHTKKFLRDRVMAIQDQISDMLPALHVQVGIVDVYGVMHPGVKITIGNAAMYVRDEIYNSRLLNEESRVVVRSL